MTRILHDPETVALALREGRLGILETDTIPGFHCLATAAAAVDRILAIKGRSREKPLLMLCPDPVSAFARIGTLDPRRRRYAERCWPGPFTLILPAGPSVPAAARSPGETVALRVPDFPWLAAILDRVGEPLLSTSVNRVGDEPAQSLEEAISGFAEQIDFLAGLPVAEPSAEPVASRPSALLDLCVWPPREIRSGPLAAPAWEDL